jgi:hypothetical protein
MAKPSQKQRNEELARRAFSEVFERNRETGFSPKLPDLPPPEEQQTEPSPVSEPSVQVEMPPLPPEPQVGIPISENKPLKKTGLHILLHRAKIFGFTHPNKGGWLMLPPEFDAILALETKAVAQIVLEILRQTVGYYDEKTDRREWAKLGHTHFHKLGLSKLQTNTGLKTALQQGYIIRRKSGDGYEYSIRFAENSSEAPIF